MKDIKNFGPDEDSEAKSVGISLFFAEGEAERTAIEIGEIFFTEAQKYYDTLLPLEDRTPLSEDQWKDLSAARELFLGAIYFFQKGKSLVTLAELEVFMPQIHPENYSGIGSQIIELRPYEEGEKTLPANLPEAVAKYALCIFRHKSSEDIALRIFDHLESLCPNDTYIMGEFIKILEIYAGILQYKWNNFRDAQKHRNHANEIINRMNPKLKDSLEG